MNIRYTIKLYLALRCWVLSVCCHMAEMISKFLEEAECSFCTHVFANDKGNELKAETAESVEG